MFDNKPTGQGGRTVKEGRESMRKTYKSERKIKNTEGSAGRRIRNGLILALVTTILLGMFVALKPAIANAAGVTTYSAGSIKLYIDKDCLDDSIDGIYCPGDYNFHYLAQKYSWRGQIGTTPGWSWLLLRDGGTDYEVIVDSKEQKDPFSVLRLEAGSDNGDKNSISTGTVSITFDTLGASDQKKYQNYDGYKCLKFHAAGREKQQMTSNWDLRVTRTNARLVFDTLTKDPVEWSGTEPYTTGGSYMKPDSTANIKKFVVNKGKTFKLPGGTRDGYILNSWYAVDPYVSKKVTVTEKNVKYAGKFAGKPGDTIAVDGSMDYYALFDPIPNTATITLINDDKPWTDTTVELYQGGECIYTLDHTSNGIYKNNRVQNGTYDVYVRGKDTGKDMTFHAVDTSTEETLTIPFFTVKLTVKLDDVMSSKPGEVTLRKDKRTAYTIPTEAYNDGYYTMPLPKEQSYDVFVNGEDTGVDVMYGSGEHTLLFYTVKVNVTDEAPWTNAEIELRDPNGRLKGKLERGDIAGNTVTYEKIIKKDGDITYNVYADGHNTHAQVKADASSRTANVTFYTARIDVTCSDKTKKVGMTLKNNLASYTMNTASGNINTKSYTCPHLLKTMNGASETMYNLEVNGAFIGDPCTILSSDKTKALTLYVVTYKQYDNGKIGTVSGTDHDKHYVFKNGYDSASSEPYISGFSFIGWGKTKQTSKDDKTFTAFDYTGTKITADTVLYPHYLTPTVEIMGYVRDNGNGTMTNNGTSFRLANLSISGFELGNKSIKFVLFNTTNVKSVNVKNTSNTIKWNENTATLTFVNSTSMAEAQEFVRKNVIFTQETGKSSTVQVTVMDKNGSATATTDNYTPSLADLSSWTDLSTKSTGATLGTGYYYLTSNKSFNNNEWGGNGLKIADNAQVTIYISPGVTLTCTGGPGSDSGTGGGAGIYLPEGAKLYFMGGGTVSSTGGQGARGGDGSKGSDGDRNKDDDDVYPGDGGAGGYGGAGAGAGIGTNGGLGGIEVNNSGKGGDVGHCDKDEGMAGVGGNDGSSGNPAYKGGDVYSDGVTNILAYGGAAGAGGSGGACGTEHCWDWDSLNRPSAGGAGGGGGGGGYAGNPIGAGGTGGSQGGGGGSAGYVWAGYYCGGGGGGGGLGGNTGEGGHAGACSDAGNTDGKTHSRSKESADGSGQWGGTGAKCYIKSDNGKNNHEHEAGKGGNGGGYGGNGTAGSVQSGTRLPGNYGVAFNKGSESGGSVGSLVTSSYTFNKTGQVIVPPVYYPGNGYYFVGWRVTKYGKNLKNSTDESKKLYSSTTTYFRQGQNIAVPQDLIGKVEFTAITALKNGLFDDSETETIPALTNSSGGATAATTFYTYTVTTKIDGVNKNAGNITIVDGSKTRSVNGNGGVYTYTTTNSGIKNVTVDGKSVSLSNRATTVNFKTVKVKLTDLIGYTRGSAGVTLAANGSASAVPAMTVPADKNSLVYVDDYTYTSTYMHSSDVSGSYYVYVNGTNTGKLASWGTTVTVDYNTVNVKPIFHGSINKDKIKRVELIDSDNNSIILVGPDNNGNWYANRLADSTVEYDLYIDGMKTGLTTNFGVEGKTLNPDIYATDVYTKVDGALKDIGNVMIGEEGLIRISAGTYQLVSMEAGSGTLSIGDRTFDTISKGTSTTMNFYTVTYDPNGAAGNVTEDITLYYQGDTATLDYQNDLVNGGKTFKGWQINGGSIVQSTYEQRGQVTMNAKVIAKAVWDPTDLANPDENFKVALSEPEFTYNGLMQVPVITVTRGMEIHPGSDDDEVITLIEGRDYTIEYVNSNTADGRNDTANKSKDINSINAGTITFTIVGKNDYTGRITDNTYTILPATLTAKGLMAVTKEYDGSPVVQLDDSKVTYTGICSNNNGTADNVKLKASGTGTCSDPYAGRNKEVETGTISLEGSSASNYVLATTDPVYVDITTRDLNKVTFTVPDVTYNNTEQKPVVTFTDNKVIDGETVNIITEDDFEITDAAALAKIEEGVPLTDEDELGRFVYANNKNAGKATVTIKASTKPLGNSIPGGEVALPNYSGTVVKEFTINPAPITVTPQEVTTTAGADDIDSYVSDKYTITSGTIYENAEDPDKTFEKNDDTGLGIKAVTEVKKDYRAGTYNDAVSIYYNKTNASNYAITTGKADHIVKKHGSGEEPTDPLSRNVSLSNATFVYDGAPHSISLVVSEDIYDEVTVYYSIEGIAAAQAIAIGTDEAAKIAAQTAPSFTDAGVYNVYYYAVAENYAVPASGSATVTINKAPLTVTAKAHEITYGRQLDSNPISESTLNNVTLTGLVTGDNANVSGWSCENGVTYTSNYLYLRDVGNYTLTPVFTETAKATGVLKNYEITCKSGPLTVVPMTISDFVWRRLASDDSSTNGSISYDYNGKAQNPVAISTTAPEVGDSLFVASYSISANTVTDTGSALTDGKAVNKGSYTAVPLTLGGTKAHNYVLGDSITPRGFSITKAESTDDTNKNVWMTSLSINGWIAEQTANSPVAAAKYGTPVFTYATRDGLEYSSTVPNTAGLYTVKAIVEETDSYNGLEATADFEIKAAPSPAEKTVIYVKPLASVVYGSELVNASVTLSYNAIDGNGRREATSDEIVKVTNKESAQYTSTYNKGSASSKNAGSYILQVSGLSLSDTTNYELVMEKGTLTVTPKPVTLTWPDNTELTYTGAAQSVTAATSDFIAGDSVSIGYSNTETYKNTASAVGNYTARAVLKGADSDNYVISEGSATKSWSIRKADNTVIVAMDDWYYGDTAPTPQWTAKFGTPTFTYYLDAGCTTMTGTEAAYGGAAEAGGCPVNAGQYWVKASVAEDEGWGEAVSDADPLVIGKAEIVLKANDIQTVQGTAPNLESAYTLTVLHGNLTSDELEALDIRLITTADKNSPVGSYPITVAYDETSTTLNNVTVTALGGTCKVISNSAKTITLATTPLDAEYVYDGNAHTIRLPELAETLKENTELTSSYKSYYSVSQLGPNNYGSGTPNPPEFTVVGSYTVYYYITAPNWKPATGSATVTITQRPVLVSANDSTIVYGDAAKNEGVYFSKTQNGQDDVEASGLIDGDDGSSFTPTYTYMVKDGETVMDTPYAVGPVNGKVGTYAIVPSLTDPKGNYAFIPEPGVMTVTKKELKADMFDDIADQTYTASAITPSVTVASEESSLLTADQYQTVYSNNTNAGTAIVTITPTENSNYSGSVMKNFKINKKAITLTAENKTSVYGNNIVNLTYTVTGTGLDTGEAKAALESELGIRLVTTATDRSEAGEYPISFSYDAIAAKNYDITVVNGLYTITAVQEMTSTEYPYIGIYDGQDHFKPVVVKTGTYNREATVYYSTTSQADANDNATAEDTDATRVELKNVGDYTVYYTAVCNGFSNKTGSFTARITKAPLTIKVPDAEAVYGGSVEAALADISADELDYAGLVGEETPSVLTGADEATFTTDYDLTAGNKKSAGTYEINVSAITSDNYDITIVKGKLTVNKKPVTFTWPDPEHSTFEYDGEIKTIAVTSIDEVLEADAGKVSAKYTGASSRAIGDHTAEITGLTGDEAGNYTISNEAVTSHAWTITAPQAPGEKTELTLEWPAEATLTWTGDPLRYEATFSTESISVLAEAGDTGVSLTFTGNTETYPGTYTAKASLTGDGADKYYIKSGDETHTWKIEKSGLDVTLTWPTEENSTFVYDGTEKSVAATLTGVEDGDEVYPVYASDTSNTSITEKAENVGTYTAKVDSLDGADAAKYTLDATDEQKQHSWSITKAGGESGSDDGKNEFTSNPELTMTGWTYGDAPVVSAAAVKYGEVIYQYKAKDADDSYYSAVVPDVPGEYTVRAFVAGTDNYNGLTSEPVDFTIAKKPVTVIADDKSSMEGENLAELTWTPSEFAKANASDEVIISAAIKDIIGEGEEVQDADYVKSTPGTYRIKLSVTGNEADRYDITLVHGYYFVTPKPVNISITASGYTGVYDGEAHGIPAVMVSGDANSRVYYSDTTELTADNFLTAGSSEIPTYTNAGEYMVYYYVYSEHGVVAGDTQSAAIAGSQQVIIQKRPVLVTANDKTITYGVDPTADPAGVVFSKTKDQSGNDVAESGFVGDEEETLAAALNPQYTYSYDRYGDVGDTFTITPSVSEEAAQNYAFTYKTGNLTVNRRQVTFKWNVNRFGYDGTEKACTADVTNLVNNDPVVPVYSADSTRGKSNTAIKVGTYTATITGITGEKSGNYYIADSEPTLTKEFEIFKTDNVFTSDLTVNNWTYGGTPAEPKCTSKYGSDAISYTYYVDEACTEMTGAAVDKGGVSLAGSRPVTPGTYFCIASIEASGEGNYDSITSNIAAFTIDKAKLDIYASNMTAPKGQTGEPIRDDEGKITGYADAPKLKYTKQGSLVNGDTLEVYLTTTVDNDSEVGEYSITFRPTEAGGGVVIMASDGETDHTSCYDVKTVEAKFYVTNNDAGQNGGVTIKPSVSGEPDESGIITYDGQFHSVNVEVLKDGEELPEADYRIYFSKELIENATAESLLQAVTDEKASVSSPTRRQVGMQKVYYYVVYNDVVYSGTETIQIDKKALVLTPLDYECYVSDPVPGSPYNGVTGEGFVSGESVKDLNSTGSVYSCSYTSQSQGPGSYVISVSGFTSSNYEISYRTGTMTVKTLIDVASPDNKVVAKNIVYTGSEVETKVFVNGRELEKNTEYTVKSGDFSGIDVGSYTFTIEAYGIYTGEKELTWKITPASQKRPDDGEGYTMAATDDGKVTITIVNTSLVTYEIFTLIKGEDGTENLVKTEGNSVTVENGTKLYIRKAAIENKYFASPFTEFSAQADPKVNITLAVEAENTGRIMAQAGDEISISTDSLTSLKLSKGTAFSLNAEPEEGYEFVKWIKSDSTGTVTYLTLSRNEIVERNQTYTAVFKHSTGEGVTRFVGIPTVKTPDSNSYTGSEISANVIHNPDSDKDCYTLSGTQGINAAVYRAVATLADSSYAWTDGTTEPKIYSWKISKAQISYLPDTVKNDRDRTITVLKTSRKYLSGKNYVYEYRKEGSGDWIEIDPVNAKITGLDANTTYFIRVKGTENESASQAVAVTIGDRITVRTDPPTQVMTTSAVLNGNVMTGSLSSNDLTYGFRLKKDGDTDYNDKIASVSGNSISANIVNLSNNTRYSYYAYVKVNETGMEVRGDEISFTTWENASPVSLGNIKIKVQSTDTNDEIPFVITVEYGNDVRMSASGVTNTGRADTALFKGLPLGNYNIVVRRTDGVVFAETRMLVIDTANSTAETVFTIPQGEIATVVNVEPGAPEVAVAGLPDIVSQQEMNAAAEGSQSTKVELKVSPADIDSNSGTMISNGLESGKEIRKLFDISLYKTTAQLDNEGNEITKETVDIGSRNNKVLEIAVPYSEMDDTTVILRVHEGEVQKFRRLPTRVLNESDFTDRTFVLDPANNYIYIYASDFSPYAVVSMASTPDYTIKDNSDVEPGTAIVTFDPPNPGKEIEAGYVTEDGFWHPIPGRFTIGPDGKAVIKGLPAGNIQIKVRLAESDVYRAGEWKENNVSVKTGDPTRDFREQTYVVHYILEYNGKQITRSTEPKSYTAIDIHKGEDNVEYYGISANREFYDAAAAKLLRKADNPTDNIISYSIVCKSVYSDGSPVLKEGTSYAVDDMRINIGADEFVDVNGIAYDKIPYLYNDIYVYANVGAYATDKNADGVVITSPVGVKYSGLPHKLSSDPNAVKQGASRSASYDLEISIYDTKTKRGDGSSYELKYGLDYTVSYKNNKEASVKVSGSPGNAYYKQIYDEANAASKWPKITITGKGNYKGMKSVLYFDILPSALNESNGAAGNFADAVKTSYVLGKKGGISLNPLPARYARNYDKYVDTYVTNMAGTVRYKLGKEAAVELQKWDSTSLTWKRLGDLTNTSVRKQVLASVVNPGAYRVKVSGIGNYCGEAYDEFNVYEYQSVMFSSLKLKTASVKYAAGGVRSDKIVTGIKTKVKTASGSNVNIPASEYTVTLLPVSESASVSTDGQTALSAGKYKAYVKPKDAKAFAEKYPKVAIDGDATAEVTVKGNKLVKKMFTLAWSAKGEACNGSPKDVEITLNGIKAEDVTLAKTVVKNGRTMNVPLSDSELKGALTVNSDTKITVRGRYILNDGRTVDNRLPGTYRIILYGRRGYADTTCIYPYKRTSAVLTTNKLTAAAADFNVSGAMTTINVVLPDGKSIETISGTGNDMFMVTYSGNKMPGTATATVSVRSDKTGYKKGSKAKITFKVNPKKADKIYAYSEYTKDLPGALFIKTADTVKAGKKAPQCRLYQASADGKKLVEVNRKYYTGEYSGNASLANTYDLKLAGKGNGLDLGSGYTVKEAYTTYTKTAKKWTARSDVKLGKNAALIKDTGNGKVYTSDDIKNAMSTAAVKDMGRGRYSVAYAGGCYVLPSIPELTVDGHVLKLANGDYTISYKNNYKTGTAKMIITLSAKTARDHGIGGSYTYNFAIVNQTNSGLTL